jgi:hypothetical protein
MQQAKHLWRGLFFIILIAALCGGLALPAVSSPARAAPQMQATAAGVVISEFRFLGPQGGNDEFIELYNPRNVPIDITGFRIMGSNNSGGTGRRLILGNVVLQPGQYYLVVNANASPGLLALQDATYSSGITDDGGVAITLANETTVIDAVGLSSGSVYKEGTPLAPLSGTADQSYERKTVGNAGNCNDTNNNVADFIWNQTSSNPQNSSSPPLVCLLVTNVTSTTADGTYSAGATIDITVTFNGVVDVTGSPTLLLETGLTDRTATYVSGSGSNTLTFRYTVVAGDTSSDLDYVATNSLALNGGTITGAIGDAILTLPSPGSTGSLRANKNIVIDNGTAPSTISFSRQTPNSPSTNANTITFRVTFSEGVTNVDSTDFVATGTTGTPTAVNAVSPSAYDVTVSGGDLNNFNGIVGLNLSPGQNIVDAGGNALPTTEPSIDEIYTVDNIAPTVSINRAATQADPTDVLPVSFEIVFSEPIDVSTFGVNDISQTGTANSVTWDIKDAGDHQTFALTAISLASNGTLIPSISANRVTDLAGNNNTPSTGNSVTFNDSTRPAVTINQASTQVDPTSSLPIVFTVVFSEPIDVRLFTTSDITQNGTATGITWSIADSGDHKTFSLSATGVTNRGTLTPSISANRVTDFVGNNNTASTSTDNTVTYAVATPTPTATATPTGTPPTPTTGAIPKVLINEVAWAGTLANADDEWMELFNPGSAPIDITGWQLYADDGTLNKVGTPNITLSGIIPAGGFFLLERVDEAVKDIPANQVYGTGTLSNSPNGERLYLKDKTGAIVDTANSDGGAWPAGVASPTYATMERVGTTTQWVTYGGTIPVAYDRNSNPIKGTPGRANWISTSTITTITSDLPDPSLVNQNVTVTVTVMGGMTIPTGTVTITGANTNCSITLSNGAGSCVVKFTSVGAKTITATYGGDSAHPASSDTEAHQVSTTTAVVTPTRTPRPTPLPPPPLIAINEFVPRPGHDWNNDAEINTGDEYIELLNHGVIDVNLSGYTLDDEVNIGSSPFSLPSIVLKPGERRVFFASETGLLLSDGGDGVRLLKPNGQLGDAYNYTVVRFPDQSYCRLPDNGGADDWNENCFPTPGLQNSLSGSVVSPPTSGGEETLCPIADTLPDDFVLAECLPIGGNIWNPAYWDLNGWFGERFLPRSPGKWNVFVD